MICVDCGRKEAEADRDLCFRCRVATVGFGWRGGGFMYGRENFTARTNAEFINEHMTGADAAPAERGVWT